MEPGRGPRLAYLTQLAEIAASFAVLATLIFLVLEVRQNTETTRATSYDRSMEALNEWRLTLAGDSGLARMYESYTVNPEGRSLDHRDFRLQLLINTLWGIYENAYFLNERGLLGETEWSRFERQICAEYERSVRSGRWDATPGARYLLTDQFASYAVASCTS